MTKIVQVFQGSVVEDLTFKFKSLKAAKAAYPPYIQILEAPDTIFPGYIYNKDGTFSEPTVPDGQVLDRATGTIYIPEVTQTNTRQQLYAEYDGEELKCTRKLRANKKDDKYKVRLSIIDAYKEYVHDTVNQTDYPLKVNYPPKPDLDSLATLDEYKKLVEAYYNG